MFFLALAADFDGTLAQHGAVLPSTIQALEQLKATGRRLLLVTGREVADLRHAFPELHLFDRVVAENGGVVLDPATGRDEAIAPAPPAALVQKLMERQVEPISIGRTIIATWHAFLKACGCSAAVANALPGLRDACDIVLSSDHGAGVAELVGRIIREDAHLLPRSRSGVLLDTDRDGQEIRLDPDQSMIIAGGSGSGKSNFAILLTERMGQGGFEFCVIDPEGDYADLDGAVTLGDERSVAPVEAVVRLLGRPGVNVVMGTLPLDLPGRQGYFRQILPRLVELKAGTGRPHWLIVDEAHHFVPRHAGPTLDGVAERLPGAIFITPDPKWLAADILRQAGALLAFGGAASGLVLEFAKEAGLAQPSVPRRRAPDEALYWSRSSPGECRVLRVQAATQTHDRHKGKYAAGNVGEAHSFHFRRKTGECLGQARNLAEFIALADTIPDEVWERHLHAGDYAAWFLHVIRDEELARIAAGMTSGAEDPAEARRDITDAIRERYVIPDPSGVQQDRRA